MSSLRACLPSGSSRVFENLNTQTFRYLNQTLQEKSRTKRYRLVLSASFLLSFSRPKTGRR